MFLKQDINNDHKVIYKLFLEFNENYINNFCNIFDKYIFLPGKTKEDIVKEEFDSQQKFKTIELLNNKSSFKKTITELNFGYSIFNLLHTKLFIAYDFAFQLLCNENTIINDWESKINNLNDDLLNTLIDLNTKFLADIRTKYRSIDFLFKVFDTDEEYFKEYDLMESNMNNDILEYNYTLDNIFKMEMNIMNEIFNVAKIYYCMIQQSKYNTFPDRVFKYYKDFDASSYNKRKHLTGKLYIIDNGVYLVNDKLLNETMRYQLCNQLRDFYNLIFLPFLFRFNDSVNATHTDNLTTPSPYEHVHPFSPFTTKSLYNLSFQIKLNNTYKEIELSSLYSKTLIRLDYTDNELIECYNYRQKQSLMIFIIYHLHAFYNLNFYILDRIKESTERIVKPINLIDEPNVFTLSTIRGYYSHSYFNSTLKIRHDYYDNQFTISDKNTTLEYEINRFNKINNILIDEPQGKDFDISKRFQFFFINMTIHSFIKFILTNDMYDGRIDEYIDLLNNTINKVILDDENMIYLNKKLKIPETNEFNQFLSNIKTKNIVYEHKLSNIVIYNTILLLRILNYLTTKYNSDKNLFYASLRKELDNKIFNDWKEFVYYSYIPFYLNTIIPEEKPSIIDLQPPQEVYLK